MNGTLVLFLTLFVFGDIVTPALCAYCWFRWSGSKRRKSRKTRLSFASLCVTTGTLLLGLGCLLYSARRTGVFLYLLPSMSHVYAASLLLSIVALLLALAGARSDNPLRGKAVVIALGSFVFWFLAASGE